MFTFFSEWQISQFVFYNINLFKNPLKIFEENEQKIAYIKAKEEDT